MAIDYPNSPTNGQIYTVGAKSWIWDGTTWLTYGASLSPSVLKVDAANARVGINNQSPAYALDVNGTIGGTQFLQGTDYLSPYQGFRNKIINGDFSIWQRGGTGGYTPASGTMEGADRWIHWWNGTGGTRSISRSTFPLGQTAVPDNPKHHMTINTSVIGSGQTVTDFWQRIENVNTFAGQTATLSFWWKSTSAATTTSNFISQIFGTGGSPSTTVDTFLSGTSLASANTWTKYSASVALPSISGKTLGTSNDFLLVGIRFLLSVACTIDISSVQLERGSVATPFEQRPIGTELTLCERYYETSFRNGQTIGHNSGNFTSYPGNSLGCGGNSYFNHFYRTRKRSTNPTLRIFDPIAAHTNTENWWRFIDACNSGTAVGPNAGVSLNADDVCFSGYLQTSATGIAPIFDWTIEAEL